MAHLRVWVTKADRERLRHSWGPQWMGKSGLSQPIAQPLSTENERPRKEGTKNDERSMGDVIIHTDIPLPSLPSHPPSSHNLLFISVCLLLSFLSYVLIISVILMPFKYSFPPCVYNPIPSHHHFHIFAVPIPRFLFSSSRPLTASSSNIDAPQVASIITHILSSDSFFPFLLYVHLLPVLLFFPLTQTPTIAMTLPPSHSIPSVPSICLPFPVSLPLH